MGIKAEQMFWYDENLPYIEVRSARNSRACYEKHTHPTLSIGIVEDGISKYHHKRLNETIGSGSVVIINPEEVHSCNPKSSEKWTYKMFHIDPYWLGKLQGEVTNNVRNYMPFNIAHSDDKRLYDAIRSLYRLLLTKNEVLEKETSIVQFFSLLLNSQKETQSKVKVLKSSKRLQVAKDYISDNLTSKLNINQISEAANLSNYYLIRAFKQKYGLTPHAFQIDQRINLSKMMLKSGTSLIETAFTTGFSDYSHFYRCFKKRVAATPRQYQKQVYDRKS